LLVGDTAFVRVSAHADVSGFAPGSAPGVLDFPVVGTVSTITYRENTVVKSSAAGAAEDTRFVELEARLIGFNGDTDRSHVNGGAQSVFGVGDILVARELGVSGHGATGGVAYTVLGGVGVGGFSAETVGLDVFEGGVH